MRDDALRAALRDLNDAAVSLVTPPGVERARRTLRRRRAGRIALACVAVLLLGVAAITLPGRGAVGPANPPTSPPTPTAEPSVAPSPSPSTSTSGEPTGTPGTSQSGGGGGGGVGLAPYFLEYGSGLSTTVSQSGITHVPVGVQTWGSGTATNVRLTVDFSRITGKVDLLGVTGPCSLSGSTVSCNFGTIKVNGEKKISATVSLQGKASAPLGAAGTVHLSLAADPTPTDTNITTGTVYVSASAADLVISSTVPSANVGQTVTIRFTVKNLGPSPDPWAEVSAGGVQPGTQYVGGQGCATTTTTFTCHVDNLAVGQSVVLTVSVKVTGCPPPGDTSSAGGGWGSAIDDPNTGNNNVQVSVTVKGCP